MLQKLFFFNRQKYLLFFSVGYYFSIKAILKFFGERRKVPGKFIRLNSYFVEQTDLITIVSVIF